MPEVTMPLAELDALRDEIKQLKHTKKTLEKSIVEIEADKRTVKITEFKENFDLDRIEIDDTIFNYIEAEIRHRRSDPHRHISQVTGLDFGLGKGNWCKRFMRIRPQRPNNRSKPHIEYVNFDDVREDIRKEMEEKYITELAILRNHKEVASTLVANLKEEHQTRILDKDKVCAKQVKTLLEEIEALKETLQRLKEGKEEEDRFKAMQKTIDDLIEELRIEKERKWYHKLFNINPYKNEQNKRSSNS